MLFEYVIYNPFEKKKLKFSSFTDVVNQISLIFVKIMGSSEHFE